MSNTNVPEELGAVAEARIAATFGERDIVFERKIGDIAAQMELHGVARGGAHGVAVKTAFLNEYRERARVAWQTWIDLLSARHLLAVEGAAVAKERIRAQLEGCAELQAMWSKNPAVQGESAAEFIETANAQAVAEIDFAVEAFDWGERRRFWISLGVNAAVGLIGALAGLVLGAG